MDGNKRDCKHGRLARLCDDCAHEREIAELMALNDKLKAERDEWQAMANDLQDDVNNLHNIHDRDARAYYELKLEVQDLKMKLIKEQARKHAAVDAVGRMGKFCIADDSDSVTENKAKELINNGLDIIGYVLGDSRCVNDPQTRIAFVVGGRVEWKNRDAWFDWARERGDDARKIIDLENALHLANKREAELMKHDTFEQAAKFRDELKCANQKIEELNTALAKEHKISCEYGNLYNMENTAKKKLSDDYRGLHALATLRSDELTKERKLRLELEKALDKVQPQIEDLQRKLSTQCEMTNKERAAHEVAHQRALELVEELKCANQKIKELETSLTPISDAFIPGIGTVHACIDCGCLVAGGPTRCVRCATESEGLVYMGSGRVLPASHPDAQALMAKSNKNKTELHDSANEGLKHD